MKGLVTAFPEVGTRFCKVGFGLGQQLVTDHQPGLPVCIAMAYRLAQGFSLEHDTGVGEVFEVRQRDRCYPKTALTLGGDQRVRHQQRQGLTQGAGADLILVFKVFYP